MDFDIEEGCQIEMEKISFVVKDKLEFLLAPVGVLDPHLRVLDGVARPHIDTSGFFLAQVSATPPIVTTPNLWRLEVLFQKDMLGMQSYSFGN